MRLPCAFLAAILGASCLSGYGVDMPGAVPAPAPAPAAVTPAGDVATSPGERLSAAARRLLASAKTSSYAHRSAIDEEAGSIVTDCSGLVSWLLRQELPELLAAIPVRPGRRHPLAADFQEAFAAGARLWQRVARVADVHPGDVLAWRLLHPQPGKSTGHVVIVDGEAVREGGGVFAIAVIDATSSPHDDDTRHDTDGIGRGVIHLRVDADGGPVAVRGHAQAAFLQHAFAIARPGGR